MARRSAAAVPCRRGSAGVLWPTPLQVAERALPNARSSAAAERPTRRVRRNWVVVTDLAYFAVARKPIAVVFVSCARDCAPYAVAPVATTVRVAPLTPIRVPAPAQVPVAVESTPLATEQPAALETVCAIVLSNPPTLRGNAPSSRCATGNTSNNRSTSGCSRVLSINYRRYRSRQGGQR